MAWYFEKIEADISGSAYKLRKTGAVFYKENLLIIGTRCYPLNAQIVNEGMGLKKDNRRIIGEHVYHVPDTIEPKEAEVLDELCE